MVMENSFICDDLKFFVDMLKSLPVSESLILSEKGSYCVSTGTYAENWVYFPERVTSPEKVNEAVHFFGERGEAFMWPVYDGGTEILEGAGLVYAGNLTAMCFSPKKFSDGKVNTHITIERVLSREMADVWADTSYRGFGGEGDTPEEYRRFAGALAADRDKKVSLSAAKIGGEYAGTFLVTDEPEMTGVYYFSTVPEFRRQGIASAMMNEICRLSAGKKIVLQSSPMGRDFYLAFGFTELFKIPVYSNDGDIL